MVDIWVMRKVPKQPSDECCVHMVEISLAVHSQDIWKQHASFRDEIAFTDIILGTCMWETHWRDRMPTKHFFHYSLDVFKIITIYYCRESVASDYPVNFILCRFLDLSGHVIEGTLQYTYSTYSHTYRIVAIY